MPNNVGTCSTLSVPSVAAQTPQPAIAVVDQDPNDVYVLGSDEEYTLEMAEQSWRHRRFAEWRRPS
jgi:hypothetical protein